MSFPIVLSLLPPHWLLNENSDGLLIYQFLFRYTPWKKCLIIAKSQKVSLLFSVNKDFTYNSGPTLSRFCQPVTFLWIRARHFMRPGGQQSEIFKSICFLKHQSLRFCSLTIPLAVTEGTKKAIREIIAGRFAVFNF